MKPIVAIRSLSTCLVWRRDGRSEVIRLGRGLVRPALFVALESSRSRGFGFSRIPGHHFERFGEGLLSSSCGLAVPLLLSGGVGGIVTGTGWLEQRICYVTFMSAVSCRKVIQFGGCCVSDSGIGGDGSLGWGWSDSVDICIGFRPYLFWSAL